MAIRLPRKRMHDNEMISIIRIRRALLGPRQQDNCQQQSLINNMCEGTMSCPLEQGEASSETRIPMSDEDSGDNLDQLDLLEDRGISIDGAMLSVDAQSDSA
ncbi:hypothetical protein CAPTEDRAFT_213863 [Capitella teleta]|uniref:Uncharacterized protein n=1 Tax=Capitella teleta TaxID=283909 RepID=R7VD15_CAPTE|nr:hypothetical protein CAPTEDRAFT_213863 [Capitella teleta]|eukprot:ELU13580.1 hypothetical protein CAPTEDRAFT_213863 [Capitella teleta]